MRDARRSVTDADLAAYMRFATSLGQARAAMGLTDFRMAPPPGSAAAGAAPAPAGTAAATAAPAPAAPGGGAAAAGDDDLYS